MKTKLLLTQQLATIIIYLGLTILITIINVYMHLNFERAKTILELVVVYFFLLLNLVFLLLTLFSIKLATISTNHIKLKVLFWTYKVIDKSAIVGISKLRLTNFYAGGRFISAPWIIIATTSNHYKIAASQKNQQVIKLWLAEKVFF